MAPAAPACAAFPAFVAFNAEGTAARVDSLRSAAVSESVATFAPLTAPLPILSRVTEPFLSCLDETLFFGRRIAA